MSETSTTTGEVKNFFEELKSKIENDPSVKSSVTNLLSGLGSLFKQAIADGEASATAFAEGLLNSTDTLSNAVVANTAESIVGSVAHDASPNPPPAATATADVGTDANLAGGSGTTTVQQGATAMQMEAPGASKTEEDAAAIAAGEKAPE